MSKLRRWGPRVVKTLVGLAVLVAAGWMPAQRLFQVSSVEAVMNAPVVTVRAPISGVVEAISGKLQAGQQVTSQSTLLTISNPRADRSRLMDHADRLENLQFEQSTRIARLAAQKDLEATLEKRVATFTANRVLQIEARLKQADARIAGAIAAFEKAKAQRDRVVRLLQKGIAPPSELEAAESDATIAEQNINELRAGRNELAVELDALRQGTFLGDSYNDRPQSAQRLDEVTGSIASLEAEIRAGRDQIAWASETLEKERKLHALDSRVVLDAPVAGEIWQVLAAPGEHVEAGEPLVNIVDCSKPMVTAAVSEAVYNSLLRSTPAAFRFREGGEPLKGRVILLSGVAEASSDYAIAPSALKRESYRVTVALDTPDAGGGTRACAIGRTGRVVFGRDAF